MTATSVTGLHKDGAGSVDGSNKGSERMTLGVGNLLGVRVVAAGTVALVSGILTITFPEPLPGSEANYVVMLTTVVDDTTWVTGKTDDADNDFISFAISDGSGSNTNDVMWMVINNAVDAT